MQDQGRGREKIQGEAKYPNFWIVTKNLTENPQNLTFVQNAAARSNARAAAIAGFVEERNRFEREIGQRHIAYKMARAEMNRDVQKLLSRGLHDPTFTLVKPIAFMC